MLAAVFFHRLMERPYEHKLTYREWVNGRLVAVLHRDADNHTVHLSLTEEELTPEKLAYAHGLLAGSVWDLESRLEALEERIRILEVTR